MPPGWLQESGKRLSFQTVSWAGKFSRPSQSCSTEDDSVHYSLTLEIASLRIIEDIVVQLNHLPTVWPAVYRDRKRSTNPNRDRKRSLNIISSTENSKQATNIWHWRQYQHYRLNKKSRLCRPRRERCPILSWHFINISWLYSGLIVPYRGRIVAIS